MILHKENLLAITIIIFMIFIILKFLDPKKIETEILSIKGVVDVGIFAINKPQIVVVGENSSYRLIES